MAEGREMTRATITTGEFPNRCTMRTQDEYGNTIERDFFAPRNGGYVREDWINPRQVCERLSGGGATLTWNPAHDVTLSALIRRERKRDMAAERRFWRALK